MKNTTVYNIPNIKKEVEFVCDMLDIDLTEDIYKNLIRHITVDGFNTIQYNKHSNIYYATTDMIKGVCDDFISYSDLRAKFYKDIDTSKYTHIDELKEMFNKIGIMRYEDKNCLVVTINEFVTMKLFFTKDGFYQSKSIEFNKKELISELMNNYSEDL